MHLLGISDMENIPGTDVKESHIHANNFCSQCWLLLKIKGSLQIKSNFRKKKKDQNMPKKKSEIKISSPFLFHKSKPRYLFLSMLP